MKSGNMFPRNLALTACLAALAIILSSSHTRSSSTRRNYDGFVVIRNWPKTQLQLDHLRSLMDAAIHDGKLQFWTDPVAVNRSVDVMVAPEELDALESNLVKAGIEFERLIEDLGLKIKQSTISNETISAFNRASSSANDHELKRYLDASRFYEQFQRYAAIEAKIRELAGLDPRISVEVVGKSSEGRNLYLVKVSNDPSANKPIVFIDGGHHAREWISHATTMYLLESLVNIDVPRMSAHYCKHEACRREVVMGRARLNLNKYDFWFIPVVNPDGYEYSHESDRLWRKTRSGSYCRGVDPNRNYPFHWNESGSSSFVCSEIYSGPRAKSEPEVRAVTDTLDANKNRIKVYLSLHCYSQLILAPYGYSQVYPNNYNELSRVASTFIESMNRLRNTQYHFGTSAMTLYPSSGGSDDYAHSLGIPLAYTLELPDTGNNGFITPPSEIIPIAHETLIGIQSMIEAS